jgi:4-amino-4-deoxy-L-arabinose transferase-like glycosyltransferase
VVPTSNERWYARAGWVLFAYVVLAVLIRWSSFFPAVLNHDESTYIVIGHALLRGSTYLTEVVDVKPVGIFLIYALFDGLVDGSIFGFRLLAALAVAASAWLLYAVARRATGDYRIGWVAGVSWILMTSLFKYYGVSPNTELFFTPLTLAAIWLAWPTGRPSSVVRYSLAGLLLGLGFMIKFVVAADALALGLLLLYFGYRNNRLPELVWRACLPLTVTFFVPFLAAVLYYRSTGLLDDFWFYTFEVTGRYPVDRAWWQRAKYQGDFLLRYLPWTIAAILALRRREHDTLLKGFLALQLVCVSAVILIPGKFFGHYQIQLMPPLALLAATYLRADYWSERAFGRLRRYGRIALPVLALGLAVAHWSYYRQRTDEAGVVFAYLQERMEAGETLYVGDFHQILYRLLDRDPPTPYVHSSLLFYEHHIEALSIDLATETERILAQRPDWITLRTAGHQNLLTRRIAEQYVPRDTLLDGQVVIWVPAGKATFAPQNE